MLAAASFPAIDPPVSSPAPQPVVFVGNRPEPGLNVRRVTWSGRLNECHVELDVIDFDDSMSIHATRTAYVALPRQLRDGQTRWQVLATGRLENPQQTDRSTRYEKRLHLAESWTETLNQLPESAKAAPPSETPTLSEALRSIVEAFGVSLNLNILPTARLQSPLLGSLNLDMPLRDALGPLLEDHGLFVQRDLIRAVTDIRERLTLRPIEHGRLIQLPLSFAAQTSPVVRLESNTETARARQWIARGDKPKIESTFDLLPGWDAGLEGQADSEYDAGLSSDFSRFANVYRRWVLNEDAALDAEPFDLATLFDQPKLTPTPLPFGDCLTQGDAGQPLAPVVEFSLDAGLTWARYTEPVERMSDRAGLMLTSTSLPSMVLAAAKAGNLRLRTTATLTSPLPIEARRWQGNPFAEVGPEIELDTSRRFKLQRLIPGSLHDAAVAAGQLTADQRDDTDALAAWLLQQLDRDTQAALNTNVEARLTLANARPEICIGDRLNDVQRQGHDLAGQPTSLPHHTASVSRVRCDFVDPFLTELTLLA